MNTKDIENLAKRLNIKADMIAMGERIEWGSDSAIMREAAEALTTLTQHHEAEVERAREEERERIVKSIEHRIGYHTEYAGKHPKVDEVISTLLWCKHVALTPTNTDKQADITSDK